jgi:hypothetical protein
VLSHRRTLTLLVSLAALSSARAAAQDQPYVLVADRHMTPAAGAIDLLTIQRTVAALEDRWLPAALFDESTITRRTLGIGYRFGKWFALDLPLDYFLMVVAHEMSGHGARLREIGADSIQYGFDPPIPYGDGGAFTEFRGLVAATRADVLGIDAAGIEVQNVLADIIGRQALGAGALHHREAWQYLESRLDGLGYIRSVTDRSPPGHDVASFLEDFNAGCDPPACDPLTAPTLKRRALLMLADPMLAYSAYGWAVSYLVRGRSSVSAPMIPLGRDLRYLPALRFEMTPYGTEWSTDHYFTRSRRLSSLSVRVGDTGAARAWGLGVRATDIVRPARVSVEFQADVWRQPPLDAPPDAQRLATGALAAATVQVPLRRSGAAGRLGLLVQGGYKTDGFVRGERLHAGPIVRAGLTFNP